MMVKFKLVYENQAKKDAKKLDKSQLKPKVVKLLALLEADPYQTPPTYEALTGNLKGFYSRRINLQHRLIYQVYEKERVVKVIRLWTHYE